LRHSRARGAGVLLAGGSDSGPATGGPASRLQARKRIANRSLWPSMPCSSVPAPKSGSRRVFRARKTSRGPPTPSDCPTGQSHPKRD
jgi:hypothetical protein